MSVFRTQISKKNLSVIETGVFYFLVYGFVGWIIDSMYRSFESGYIIFGGMFQSFLLPIPFAPIYGFGALILLAFKKTLLEKNPVIAAVLAGLIMIAIEYVGGEMTVAIFHHRAWDYSQNLWNVEGHIDLLHGILWVFLGWAFIRFIHPAVEKSGEKFLAWVKNERTELLDKIREM